MVGLAGQDSSLALRVTQNPVTDLRGEVEPAAIVLEHVDHADGLPAVVESARNELGQDALAGVSEGRVPQVVTHHDGLGQRFVEAQRPRDGARDLRNLQGVGQPRAVVVALGREKDLRLAGQAAKGLRVQDAIAVVLEDRADLVRRFGALATQALAALLRVRRKDLLLVCFKLLTNCHAVCSSIARKPPTVSARFLFSCFRGPVEFPGGKLSREGRGIPCDFL